MAPKPKRPAHVSLCLPHDALREPYGLLSLGGAVAVELLVAKTADVAVVVRHVCAYPEGFSFALVIRLRRPDPALPEATRTLHFNPRRANRQSPEHVYLRIELAGGQVLTLPYEGLHAGEPALRACAASTTPACFSGEFAAPVLPSSGNVAFVCDWARYGLSGARATVPASRLAKAAARAKPLWEVDDAPRVS
jgi:hypothetical protein